MWQMWLKEALVKLRKYLTGITATCVWHCQNYFISHIQLNISTPQLNTISNKHGFYDTTSQKPLDL